MPETSDKFPETGARKELLYTDIPILKPEDVLQGWGFVDFATKTKKYFLGALTRALQQPDWLLISPGSEEYKERELKGLPVSQSFDPGNIETLKKLLTVNDFTQMAEAIESMSDGFYGIRKQDIVIRALQIMSEDYPNLSFFRGTSYGNLGPDFAPGYLPTAINHASFSVYTGTRRNPVIAIMSFSDLVREYAKGEVRSFSTEGSWWRNSMEIYLSKKAEKEIVTYRKPPQSKNAEQAVLSAYQEKGIHL